MAQVGQVGQDGQGRQVGQVRLSKLEPMQVYVAWHPRCTFGAALATAIRDGLSGTELGLERSWIGVPVYFRTSCEPDRPPTSITVEDGVEHVVVIPIIDAHFAASVAWREWLQTALGAIDATRRLVLPLPLTPGASRISGLERTNTLKVPPQGAFPRVEQRAPPVVRQIVIACARALLETKEDPWPRTTIFLSHAKRDGDDITQKLRAAIALHGQFESFYDDHDLPRGDDFAAGLDQAVQTGTAAMIVVQTSVYATRPWCRRELWSFRRPTKVQGSARVWSLRPLVVVDAITGSATRALSELGGAPVLPWTPAGSEGILDRLAHEVLYTAYNRRRAEQVADRCGAGAGTFVIDWVPDPYTVMALGKRLKRTRIKTLIHPGDGLSRIEKKALDEWWVGSTIELKTFGEVIDGI